MFKLDMVVCVTSYSSSSYSLMDSGWLVEKPESQKRDVEANTHEASKELRKTKRCYQINHASR
jgi:hypothetical protein